MNLLSNNRIVFIAVLSLVGCGNPAIFYALDESGKKDYCINEWGGASKDARINHFCASAFNKLGEDLKIGYCVRHLKGTIIADIKPNAWLHKACLSSKMHPRDKLVLAELNGTSYPAAPSSSESTTPPSEQPDQCALAKARAEKTVKEFDEWGDENALAHAAGVPRSELPAAPRVVDALQAVRDACP